MTLLANWLWQGLAIAALAAAVVRLVSPLAAARRHQVWWTALVLVVAVPALWSARALGLTASSAGVAPAPASRALVDAEGWILLPALPEWLTAAMLCAWALWVAVGTLRLVHGWLAIRGAVRRAAPLGAREADLALWMRLRHTARQPELKVSSEIRGACAVGLGRPAILLSSSTVASLDDARLEHVVLHELAHLERYDDWTRLAQRALIVVAGVHPAVPWLSRRIDLEMEAACDQRAALHAGDAGAYAASLLDVAALPEMAARAGFALVPGASARMPMLRIRIERLTDMVRGRPVRFPRVSSVAAVAVLSLASAAATLSPAAVRVERVDTVVPDVAAVPLARAAALVEHPVVPNEAAVGFRRGTARRVVGRPFPPASPAASPTSVSQRETVGVSADAPSSAHVSAAASDTLVPRPLVPVRAVVPAPLGAAAGFTLPGVRAAQQSAAGITRAAQSTAGAFTRVGQAVASRF